MLEEYYRDEFCTIFKGDCRKVLPWVEDADLLLTDPPYGIGVCPKGTISSRKQGSRDYKPVTWDSAPPPRWLIDQACDKTRHQIIWGGGHIGGLPRATCWLFWDKRNDGMDFSQGEVAWTNLDRAVRLFRWLWSGCRQEIKEERFHPTQKPVPLMEWCLSFVPKAQTVLDPFAGSGSTLVAAKRLGLRSVGIEMDEDYCRAAAARLRATEPGQRPDQRRRCIPAAPVRPPRCKATASG